MNDDQLDALLREAVERLTPLPPTLTPNVERRLHTVIWRRRVVGTLALAASIAGIWFASHLFSPPTPVPMVARVEPPKLARPDVRVTFPKDAHVIAVPIESDNPNVTVVMVYQAVRPTQKNRSHQ